MWKTEISTSRLSWIIIPIYIKHITLEEMCVFLMLKLSIWSVKFLWSKRNFEILNLRRGLGYIILFWNFSKFLANLFTGYFIWPKIIQYLHHTQGFIEFFILLTDNLTPFQKEYSFSVTPSTNPFLCKFLLNTCTYTFVDITSCIVRRRKKIEQPSIGNRTTIP